MSESPEISVIVPLYNKGPYIARALASIMNQRNPFREIIVVNDGSTDDGPKVVRDFQADDNRIHLINQTNSGPAAARNRGIRESRGSLVAFLDADDDLVVFIESHDRRDKVQPVLARDDDRAVLLHVRHQ